ncbi:4-(cytidine 5'-diphospho)-2-C-methyl-D-erythritol kinase [Microbaculum sp. A6E488]|uniref:4-diphosphocytidyl-2-C-methyl-D-erythritol kinase n=1 Tax=Microbaculum marinisediminis TaxID=2931392 RepID=A0AAW5QVB0_9HYPH|nr:4-(cytidine 5'-diphospho)-2-C-methyl-D-erythritol kinase [Microbaculum sp. A6E488]
MANAIAEQAPAKVNLALAVTGRRRDGYHLIDTLAVFADIGDRLSLAPAAGLSLDVTGPFSGDLSDPGDNLVLRAATMLRDAAFEPETAPGAQVRLEKHLPVASGIGGGSADAAAALRGLNSLWRLDWTEEDLAGLGVRLGADIPMCLTGRPLRATGIGEDIAPLRDFPALHLVLVNPGVAVSTAEVFAGCTGRFSGDLPDPSGISDLDSALVWLGDTANDLEGPAIRIAPVVDAVLNALRAGEGCLLARMSGSGATCFGIYRDDGAARAAAESIRAARPHWWAVATKTGGGSSTSG